MVRSRIVQSRAHPAENFSARRAPLTVDPALDVAKRVGRDCLDRDSSTIDLNDGDAVSTRLAPTKGLRRTRIDDATRVAGTVVVAGEAVIEASPRNRVRIEGAMAALTERPTLLRPVQQEKVASTLGGPKVG